MKTIRRYKSLKPVPPEERTARYVPSLVPAGTTSTTFTGPVSGTPDCFVGKALPVEVVITDSATVLIEGRPNPTLGWITAGVFTATANTTIPAMTELRATVSKNTGAVSVIQRP